MAHRETPARPRAAKADRYHHGDLRNALLRAAEALLETQDAETISLRAVARAAGVSPAAPYHHFASKEELFAALAAEGFRAIDAEMRAEADAREGAVERFRGLGVGYVRWARAHRGVYKIMHGQGRYLGAGAPELAEAAAASYELLRSHVAAVAALVPGADEALEARIRTAAWSVVHGLAMLMVDGAIAPPEAEDLDAFVDDVLRRGVAGMAGVSAA